jgi:glutamyl-tRNA reductase
MLLSVTGVSHNTAPIEMRETLALAGERLAAALRRSRTHVAECVILSTCNRFEVYTLQEETSPQPPGQMLTTLLGELPKGVDEHLYSHSQTDAAAHLFRVASGIKSLVLGEVQILGQAQRAWQCAHEAGAAGPVLSQLFHRAVALGKRVHNETPISRQPASVSYAAVVLSRRIFGESLAERRALVIGTGEVGEGVARCLHDYGVRPTVVAHRQIERAESIARRYEARIAAWDDLPKLLVDADIVISSTAAPHYILQRHHIEDALQTRGEQPLYLIDLAVPRDIDPEAAELPGVHLHNVDDLQSVVRTSLEERARALPEIEAMVATEASKFASWLVARSTAPAIDQMRAQARVITRNELSWALAKLPNLSERERRVVEALAARIEGKLLHGPIQWLKAQADGGRLAPDGPDYGMSRLSSSELEQLFYRSGSGADGDEQQTVRMVSDGN